MIGVGCDHGFLAEIAECCCAAAGHAVRRREHRCEDCERIAGVTVAAEHAVVARIVASLSLGVPR